MKIKEWSKLEYHDSRKVLLKLREVQEQVVSSDLPAKVKNLRTKELKKYQESRQAAIFCYGVGVTVINTEVYHALSEVSDYDCIAFWNKDGQPSFMPIQLKELVPQTLNSNTTLTKELEKLKKYVSSEDLVVALYVNRACRLDFSDIKIPELNVAQVWLFGGLSSDQSQWFVYGDLLNNPEYYEFSYPTI